MQALINICLTVVTFLGMEWVAWFTHKYIMHGWLWKLHKDHHVKEEGFFEKNDFFFLIFATPSLLLFYFGAENNFDFRVWIGLGIALYGIAYFVVHDIFIHQRFKILKLTSNPYLKAIRKAHKTHHKYLTKEQGECFGMLVVPLKYYLAARKEKAGKNLL